MLLTLLKKVVRSSKDIVEGFGPQGVRRCPPPQFELVTLESRIIKRAV